MKKFAFAAVFTLAIVSLALAEDINVVISKIDTAKSTITYTKKAKKGEEPGAAVTVAYTKSVKVAKGKMDPDNKGKWLVDEEIKDGVKAEPFTKIDEKGLPAVITVADSGADKGLVTSILLTKGKGGKKGGGN